MIRVFESAAGSARLHEAERFVLGNAVAGEVRIVAATRGAADDFVRRLALTRGSTLGLHRFSWNELVARQATVTLAASGHAIASRLGIEAVAARAVFQCRDEGTLGRFEDVSQHPGFARSVAATILELRLAALSSEESPEDLRPLRSAYESCLAEARLVDYADLVGVARSSLEASGSEGDGSVPTDPLATTPVLLLDVPIGSAAERDLLAAFLRRAPAALFTLPAGDDPTWAWLRELGTKKTVQAEDPGPGDLVRLRRHLFAERAAGRAERDDAVELFSAPGEGRECVEVVRRMRDLAREGVAFDQMAVFLRAPELYAAHLETALRRAGIPAYFARGTKRPDPAGRAFLALLACKAERLSARRFAEYLSFGEVPELDEYGAPPDRGAVWVAPTEETFGAVAEVAARVVEEDVGGQLVFDFGGAGFASGSVATSVSGSAMISDDAGVYGDDQARPLLGGTLRTPWKWEEYLVEAAVIQGRDRWARRLRGFENELRIKLAQLRREESDESPRIQGLETELLRLQHFERFALPVIAELDGLGTGVAPAVERSEMVDASSGPTTADPAGLTTGDAHSGSTAVDADSGPMAADIDARPTPAAPGAHRGGSPSAPARATWGVWLRDLERLAPRVLRDPTRVLEVLAEMRPMAEIGPVGIEEVRAVLADRLANLERRPPGDRYGKVFVGTPDQARGRTFRIVFVPGVAERLFPQRPREDPLFLDADRRRRSSALATRETRAVLERLRLRTVVGAAVDRLVLSWPRLDIAQGRPRVPSFYALDVARAVGGVLPGHEELERDARRARLAWPAPPRAQDAIDALEHDLAVLGSLLESPSDGANTGRARYLLELNPHLARSLRARYARWSRGRWSHWDGMIRATERTGPHLAAEGLAERPYSVTALQKFAVCPYQFFLSAIFRLEPREDAVQPVQMDPLTRGRLIHEVQALTLRRLRAAGNLPLLDAASSQPVLDLALDEIAGKFEDDLDPAIDRVWDDEVAAIRADLRVWLQRLAESGRDWEPRYFELAFGLADARGKDEASVRDPVLLPGGYRLVGAIDLVERSVVSGRLRITDHKTGRDLSREIVYLGGGEILQPVLYALAAEGILGEPVERARLSFCTARGGFRDHEVGIDDFARLYAGQLLSAVDTAVRGGVLPPAPRAEACDWCDFRAVCGPFEEQRQMRKDPGLLTGLRVVREQP